MATILSPTGRRTQNFREVHFKVEEVVAPATGILPEPEVQGVEAGSEIHLGQQDWNDGMVGAQSGHHFWLVSGWYGDSLAHTTSGFLICVPCSEPVYQRENVHVNR